MKNVFITGSGRSGTSMLAGMFANAGYFLGDRLYPAREANPKGFFEDEHVNALNEEIITYSLGATSEYAESNTLLARYKKGHFWLARFPIEFDFLCNAEQRTTIRSLTARQPFCFKDPRFCFTLEAWTEVIPDSVVLCIFRKPASTVESILKECRTEPYLFDFSTSVREVFSIWREMYWRMLRLYRRCRNIRFVYHGDVIAGTAIGPLEDLVGAQLDRTFPEASLDRASSTLQVDELSLLVFDALVDICGQDFGESRDTNRLNLAREVDERLSRCQREVVDGGVIESGVGPLSQPLEGNAAGSALGSLIGPRRETGEVEREQAGHLHALTTSVEALRDALRATASLNREYIGSLQRTIAHQEEEIAGLKLGVTKQGEEIAALKSEVNRRDGEIVELQSDLARGDEEIAGLKSDVTKREEEIAALHASTSWRITKPIRTLKGLWLATRSTTAELWRRKSLLRALLPSGHGERYQVLRKAYRTFPLSAGLKRWIADRLLWRFPALRDRVFGAVVAEGLSVRIPDLTQIRAGRPDGPPRILIVDQRIPTPDRTGGSVRMAAIVRMLRELGLSVTMISDWGKDEYRWIHVSVDEVRPYEEMLERLDIPFLYGHQAALHHLHDEGHTYRYVVLSFPEIAHRYFPAARAYAVHAKVIYDTVDLHGLRMDREADIIKDEAIVKKAMYFNTIEKLNFECSDLIIAISNDEKEYIRKKNPNLVVEIIPNVHENSITPHPISGRDGLIFIGNYLHTPNEDAMVYFADQILPLMRQRIPSMTLTMLGACMTERVRRIAAPCIRAVGYVSDAVPYFQKARVFVAPLRYGAGMKGKIGHSMSLGLPVVTTTIGAEGLGLVNGENALIADEPEDFSEAVIALCENDALWQRLSANGRAHIQENFSEAAVRNALRGIFLAPA